MTVAWDPGRYLRFADERRRPGLDLLGRIPHGRRRLVVDLGCGTGHLTAALADRWPDARVVGVDSSSDMLERPRAALPGLEWVEADIARWAPPSPPDVIYSNAALHWVDDHAGLIPRLLGLLSASGVLAVQMPNNWDQPTHTVPARILDEPGWPEEARDAHPRRRVASPADYRRWASPAAVVDIWETIYHHPLTGPDPVLEWVKGSLLRPVLQVLDPDEGRELERRCAEGYRSAYPPDPDGVTLFPFRRLFIVAVRG